MLTNRFVFACLVANAFILGAAPPKSRLPDPVKLVVVGDSLSAGVQNFSLIDVQQPFGYAPVIAHQANWDLALPFIPSPGAPNQLNVVGDNPTAIVAPKYLIAALPGSLTTPRDNPCTQATDIAVPGLTVPTAATLRPSPTATQGVQAWATLVLGFPNFVQACQSPNLGQALTEIETAVSLKPNLIIEWLGSNDVLVPALSGQLNTVTTLDQFASSYDGILKSLSQTGARIVTANIPDITEIPYFTSTKQIARKAHRSVFEISQLLNIGPGDYVRPTALPLIDAILSGQASGPLRGPCQAPLPDLGVDTLPCVLTASQAAQLKRTVSAYNFIIALETWFYGGTVVDIHRLVDNIYHRGYRVSQGLLSANFLGGLFSLDGVHPNNTGYSVIANEFIGELNRSFKAGIPAVNVSDVFATDPLAQYVTFGK